MKLDNGYIRYYHNTVSESYLTELSKLITGETQTINLEIEYIELIDTDGNILTRKAFVEKATVGPQSVCFATFTQAEANGDIAQLKIYYNNPTITQGTGSVAATVNVEFTKTSANSLTIEYIWQFKNT
jgi:hypothetical protein